MGSAWELELVTDRRLNVRLLVIRDVDVGRGGGLTSGLDLEVSFLGLCGLVLLES